MDMVLTIDSTIQDIIEREMNNLMERYKPKSALALAMNPKTGEVLAMVSKPDFDRSASSNNHNISFTHIRIYQSQHIEYKLQTQV